MSQYLKRSTITTILLAAALGWAGYEIMGIVGKPNGQPQADTEYCQLSTEACRQQNATIKLASDFIHPMQGSQISVSWPELPKDTNALILSLEGREMMMGVYQLELVKTANGHFTGDLMLPFCISEEMTWQGSIRPLTNSEQITPINVSVRMIK